MFCEKCDRAVNFSSMKVSLSPDAIHFCAKALRSEVTPTCMFISTRLRMEQSRRQVASKL